MFPFLLPFVDNHCAAMDGELWEDDLRGYFFGFCEGLGKKAGEGLLMGMVWD